MDEPTYVEAGDEFGDLHANKRPKWMTPKGKWQKRILKAAHRKYYRDREEQKVCNQIARQAVPQAVSIDGYHIEWIEYCCEWCEKKWFNNKPVKLWGLLNFILDHDKKIDWIASNKEKPVDMRPKPASEWRTDDEN